MNYVVGKFGKSILFNKKNWGPIGGDAAPSLTFSTYARLHPEHTFYMIGKSDLTRYRKKFPENDVPSNLIDVWENKSEDDSGWETPYNRLKDVSIDGGMFFMGPTGRSNIPNFMYTIRNPTEKAKSLGMFINYAAPIIHYLNKSKVPFFILSEDPRYVAPAMQDLINVEKFALSQFNKVVLTERVKSEEEIRRNVVHKVKYEASGIETLFLLNEKKPDLLSMKKDIPFTMFLHGNDERFAIVKQWFIDKKIPVKIYGRWGEFEEKYPDVFKDVPMADMMDEVYRTKYTLILGRKFPNFVTQKYWETINLGIVPFIHREYDSDKLLPIPEYLRVKSPSDMLEKMTYLDNNPDEYRKILRELDSSLDIRYYNGEFVDELLTKSLGRLHEKPVIV